MAVRIYRGKRQREESNAAAIMIHLPAVLRDGVIPRLKPTVPKADMLSNINAYPPAF
jgi:hypothetical protein